MLSLTPGSHRLYTFSFSTFTRNARTPKKKKNSSLNRSRGVNTKCFKVNSKSLAQYLHKYDLLLKILNPSNLDLHQTSSSPPLILFCWFYSPAIASWEILAHFIHCAQRLDTPYTLLLGFILCRATQRSTKHIYVLIICFAKYIWEKGKSCPDYNQQHFSQFLILKSQDGDWCGW